MSDGHVEQQAAKLAPPPPLSTGYAPAVGVAAAVGAWGAPAVAVAWEAPVTAEGVSDMALAVSAYHLEARTDGADGIDYKLDTCAPTRPPFPDLSVKLIGEIVSTAGAMDVGLVLDEHLGF